jgi:DNA mismatch repair protein MSH3
MAIDTDIYLSFGSRSTNSKDREEIRVEKILDIFDFSEAFNYLTNFYNSGRQSSGDSDGADPNRKYTNSGTLCQSFTARELRDTQIVRFLDPAMAGVVDLPNTVTIALAHTLQHLEAFGLAGTLMETSLFARFTTRSHMLLNASTISNLSVRAILICLN